MRWGRRIPHSRQSLPPKQCQQFAELRPLRMARPAVRATTSRGTPYHFAGQNACDGEVIRTREGEVLYRREDIQGFEAEMAAVVAVPEMPAKRSLWTFRRGWLSARTATPSPRWTTRPTARHVSSKCSATSSRPWRPFRRTLTDSVVEPTG